jgi:hypothetical protein
MDATNQKVYDMLEEQRDKMSPWLKQDFLKESKKNV